MVLYKNELTKVLQLTEEVYKQAKTIHSNMKDNEDGKLDELQSLLEKRGQAILRLDAFIQKQGHQWIPEDRYIIEQLKELEIKLQPLITGLYNSFSNQMKRINQTKQASKKYIGAYQMVSTDGSFIDKRN
ncbi:flagellar protein FliT [Planomicrobium sp. CPCC 101110]|uniref:flagellar protein FliT n=1 Tax=Planomicrobium sp. CPCC 101110 TaxID=2599619 RepID=UPI0011B473E3|nr:flagellar protein FliT [Planomicrobium sp. CPCC 101110]TWT27810.1 flagellar protein FliT [Planomicrobium sp. CPCC 101110]